MFTFVFLELLLIFSEFITLSTLINYSTPVWLICPFTTPTEGIERTVLRDALIENPDYFNLIKPKHLCYDKNRLVRDVGIICLSKFTTAHE